VLARVQLTLPPLIVASLYLILMIVMCACHAETRPPKGAVAAGAATLGAAAATRAAIAHIGAQCTLLARTPKLRGIAAACVTSRHPSSSDAASRSLAIPPSPPHLYPRLHRAATHRERAFHRPHSR
jgi:hypothetical protein